MAFYQAAANPISNRREYGIVIRRKRNVCWRHLSSPQTESKSRSKTSCWSFGTAFDAADASFELLLRRELDGSLPAFFEVESWRVITDARGDDEALSEATVKVVAAGERGVRTGEGNGPVNALDHALRSALAASFSVARW